MNKKLIIYGTGEFAAIAYEYFKHDSPYDVAAFTVERKFINKKTFYNLPIVPFEAIVRKYPPTKYDMFVALSYRQLNRLRSKYYSLAKKKRYKLASYVSSQAFVWHSAKIGDNCMILEHNVIQHGVTIGNDVFLWSGNHIGHRAYIANHVYIASHCVISGFTKIGAYSFLGINSSFNENLTIAPDTLIGSGTVVIKNTKRGGLYVGNPARLLEKSSYEVFKVKTI